MKKITVKILMLSMLIIVSGCSIHDLMTTDFVYMRDITGSMRDQQLQKTNMESFFKLDENLWNGGNFKLLNISDVSYNYTYEISIKAENDWLGNELKRKKAVKSFYSGISKIISKDSTVKQGKPNSSIYAQIARELNILSKSPSQRKIMVINSDLMENTNKISFYKHSVLNTLKSKPDSVIKYFNSQVPLQRLEGIKVYLIYQPENMLDDELYQTASDLYKKILESKGAEVKIGANLINNE